MIGAIVLAAGASSRLGQPKQFVVRDGETLVHRAARLAHESGCSPVVVVEGAVPLAAAVADLPVEVVRCEAWREGQGASVKAGVAGLGSRCSGVVVLLVDQHRVAREDLVALLEAPGAIAAASYDGVLGVPVRFSGETVEVLRGLSDSEGARRWLAQNGARVSAVSMPNAAVDLDTPDDLVSAGGPRHV